MTDFMEMTERPELPVEFRKGDPTKRMSVEWASDGLTWLYANRPQVFADMMTEGVLGIEKRTRGR